MPKEEAKMTVEGITDCSLATSLEKMLMITSGIYFASVNVEQRLVDVWYNSDLSNTDQIKAVIEDQGYEVKEYSDKNNKRH